MGIGTTNPTVTLDVNGPVGSAYLMLRPQDTVFEGGELRLLGAGTNGDVHLDNFQGNVRFHTFASGKRLRLVGGINATGSATNFFAGNVGIGVTSPGYNLDVSGAIRSAATGSGDALVIGDDTKLVDINVANVAGLYSTSNAAVGGLRLGNAAPVIFGTSGGVGVGTGAPVNRLTVTGEGTGVAQLGTAGCGANYVALTLGQTATAGGCTEFQPS